MDDNLINTQWSDMNWLHDRNLQLIEREHALSYFMASPFYKKNDCKNESEIEDSRQNYL